MCKVIAVSCSKGGVGKTTSAVNIGIGLAYSGKKVLLLDVDGQGDLSKSLGVENPGSLDYTIARAMVREGKSARNACIFTHNTDHKYKLLVYIYIKT